MSVLTITTQTLVNGRDLDTLDVNDLLQLAEKEKKFKDRLESSGLKSPAVGKLLRRHDSNLKKLAELLETKVAAMDIEDDEPETGV